MVDKLRQIVEWQVLELIKKMSEFGKMTNEQAQQIAKRTIELLKPGMSLEEFFKNVMKIDDGLPELSFIVLPLAKIYQEKIENPSIDAVRELVRKTNYDTAVNLSQKIVDQDIKIKFVAQGKLTV